MTVFTKTKNGTINSVLTENYKEAKVIFNSLIKSGFSEVEIYDDINDKSIAYYKSV